MAVFACEFRPSSHHFGSADSGQRRQAHLGACKCAREADDPSRAAIDGFPQSAPRRACALRLTSWQAGQVTLSSASPPVRSPLTRLGLDENVFRICVGVYDRGINATGRDRLRSCTKKNPARGRRHDSVAAFPAGVPTVCTGKAQSGIWKPVQDANPGGRHPHPQGKVTRDGDAGQTDMELLLRLPVGQRSLSSLQAGDRKSCA